MNQALLAPILRIAELRALELKYSSAPLMERAGAAAADDAGRLIEGRGLVIVLAGPGNNGGDAFVVARLLRERFFDVHVVFRGDARRLPQDARAAHDAFVAAGGRLRVDLPNDRADLIVDGLFGIGLTRPIAEQYAELVSWANESGTPILALDVPSGLDAETGTTQALCIKAAATSTFISMKPGLLTGNGPDMCGEVCVHALGLALPDDANGHVLAWQPLARALPAPLRRTAHNVHKGTFGTLAVVGGASGMTGATILAGRAALRLGAGRVKIGMLSEDRLPYDPVMPELMITTPDEAMSQGDALVLGPGLGRSDTAKSLVEEAIARDVALLLDADALNLIAQHGVLQDAVARRKIATLMTPHPTEAARLLACDTAEVQRDRVGAALTIAQRMSAHVVLKGAGSVLAYPDGRFDINTTGSAALASAGTGDVLSGMAGAFLAQRMTAIDSLRYAVCLHGAAADALVASGDGPLGVVASELADAARGLVNAMTGNRR